MLFWVLVTAACGRVPGRSPKLDLYGERARVTGAYDPVESLSAKTAGWRYALLLRPEDVPLPPSATGAPDARVAAVYSPSVVRFGGRLVMLFGVSIGCRGGTVARDSIALAVSSDGLHWTFDRYLLEPDTTTCLVDTAQWSTGALFQVNDPAAYVSDDGDSLYVVYTSVFWRWPAAAASGNLQCGVLGLAVLRRNLSFVQRQDQFLVPTEAESCVPTRPGYSRPDIEWNAPGGSRLWFDTGGNVRSVPLRNLNAQSDRGARNEGLDGRGLVDVHVPVLDPSRTILMANGATLTAMTRPRAGGAWSAPWAVTTKSGQGWDRDGQGSPWLYLEQKTCRMMLYFAGVSDSSPSHYTLNIGVAVPTRHFRLPACR